MKEFLYVHKTKIISCAIGITILFIILWPKLQPASEAPNVSILEALSIEENHQSDDYPPPLTDIHIPPAFVLIDIKGAVKVPGVYEMKEGERIIDAVERAGGFLEEADTRKVNLAALLADEMVIIVPKEGEVLEEPLVIQQPSVNGNKETAGGKVNINTATEEELTKLTGVGPSKAKAIINYRTEHGLFKSIEDLVQVSGIGAKSLEKIRNEITVSN